MRSGIDVIKQLLQVGVLFAIQVFVELYISKYYKLPQRERMFNISIPVLTGFNKLKIIITECLDKRILTLVIAIETAEN